MRVTKEFVSLALVLALCVPLAPTQAFASYGMGNYYCAQTVHVPAQTIENQFWEFAADVGSAVGGYGAAAITGATGGTAVAVGAAGTWVLRKTFTYVPASTYCAQWVYATNMNGNSYQY